MSTPEKRPEIAEEELRGQRRVASPRSGNSGLYTFHAAHPFRSSSPERVHDDDRGRDSEGIWPPAWPEPVFLASSPSSLTRSRTTAALSATEPSTRFAAVCMKYAAWRSASREQDFTQLLQTLPLAERPLYEQVDMLWNGDRAWASGYQEVDPFEVSLQLVRSCLDPKDPHQDRERKKLRSELVAGKKVKQPQILYGGAPFKPPSPRHARRRTKSCLLEDIVKDSAKGQRGEAEKKAEDAGRQKGEGEKKERRAEATVKQKGEGATTGGGGKAEFNMHTGSTTSSSSGSFGSKGPASRLFSFVSSRLPKT